MNTALNLLNNIYKDKDFAKSISPNLFPTSISYEQGVFLVREIKKIRPKTIVELGYGYGVSALWIQMSMNKSSTHIIVDPTPISANNEIVNDYLKKEKNVRFQKGYSSQQFLADYQRKRKKADLFFVDADERFDGFMADMYFISKTLHVHGSIFIRNIWNPSIRKGILFLIKNLPFTIKYLSAKELILIKNLPILGEKYLQNKYKNIDFCILELHSEDNRVWDHYISF